MYQVNNSSAEVSQKKNGESASRVYKVTNVTPKSPNSCNLVVKFPCGTIFSVSITREIGSVPNKKNTMYIQTKTLMFKVPVCGVALP